MSDEKKDNNLRRKVPQVTWNILGTAEEVKRILPMKYPRGTDSSNWILEVDWEKCSLSEFGTAICEAELDRVPIALDVKQTERLWCYLAFYYEAFLLHNKSFYDPQHKAPDFAIVSALFRETEWGAIGLMDKQGIKTRELLSQAMNLLYYTRYADVVHSHFVVELQMIFATLRKQEEGPDEPPKHLTKKEKFDIENNWLTFCNFLSLVSDIDSVPLKNKQINVLGDLRLMVQSLMRYVSFGLQYVYDNVKKMPKGNKLCETPNWYHEKAVKVYLLTQIERDFRIIRSENCNEMDIAQGLRQFAIIFVNPWFQSLLANFNNHILKLLNRRWEPGQVKSVERMLQKAQDLMQQKTDAEESKQEIKEDLGLNSLEDALLSLHDICRASFCFQLPEHFLEVIELLQNEYRKHPLTNLEVIRITNLFNRDANSLKDERKKMKENKIDPKHWSQEGIMHYRNLKIDVKIILPETVTYIDRKGNRFTGSVFIGEIELLMDSYLYAKKETHKYWKLQRIRKSKDLLDLPLWEHPEHEMDRKSRRKKELQGFETKGAWLRGGSERCWRSIKSEGKKYVDKLNKNQASKHEIRFTAEDEE